MRIKAVTLFVLFLLYPMSAKAMDTESPKNLDVDPVHLKMHKLMAQATYFVRGPSRAEIGKECGGTAFLLLHPFYGEDTAKVGWKGDGVLITAKHVFEDIVGDFMIFDGRTKDERGNWKKKSLQVRIRDGAKNLYYAHPTADVAAMWFIDGLAVGDEHLIWTDIKVATFMLATDDDFEKCNLSIGSPLSCLGYPLGIPGNEEGFPILRTGAISSYPILPTSTHRTFHFDFEVYPGNSGGPVYYFEPGFESAPNEMINMKKTAAKTIVGLVSQQVSRPRIVGIDPMTGKQTYERDFLKLGVVVSSPVIRETLTGLRHR